VNVFEAITHRRDAELAKITQSKTEIRAPLSALMLCCYLTSGRLAQP